MRKVASVLGSLLIFAYPALVYYATTRGSARLAGLVVLALIGPRVLLSIRGDRAGVIAVVQIFSVIGLLALVAVLIDHHASLLALPAAVNGVLLVAFSLSLRGTPIIERFARGEKVDLNAEEVRYCRTVTLVWCGFFALNGAAAAALAVWGPTAWWALYNGLIAYMLVGLLFAGEYVVRKARFREFSSSLHDRVIAALLPRRRSEP